MMPPYMSLFMRSVFLTLEMQQVITLRLLRIAAGGTLAKREWQRMYSEKALAASQIGFDAALDTLKGKDHAAIVERAVKSYQGRVRQNRRRLSGH